MVPPSVKEFFFIVSTSQIEQIESDALKVPLPIEDMIELIPSRSTVRNQARVIAREATDEVYCIAGVQLKYPECDEFLWAGAQEEILEDDDPDELISQQTLWVYEEQIPALNAILIGKIDLSAI